MAYASKSVLSGRSVRPHLKGFGAFVGTGILALGVVAAPPDSHSARPEFRAVQLTASPWPAAPYLQAAENFVIQRAQILVPAANPVAGSGTTNSGAAVTSPTVQSASRLIAAATAPQTAAAPTVAAGASALAAPGFFPLAVIVAVVELALFAAPLVLGAFLLCPPCVLINELSYFIPGLAIPFAALPAVSQVVAAPTTAVPTSTAVGEPIDTAPPADRENAESLSVAPTAKRTHSDELTAKKTETTTTQLPTDTEAQTATETKDATEAVGANEETTEPTSARTAEPSPAPSSSEPEKTAVRGSHRDEGVHRTTGTVAAAEGSASTAGSSSTALSPAHPNAEGRGSSASGDSSGADGAGS
jgi:hypothetical protein